MPSLLCANLKKHTNEHTLVKSVTKQQDSNAIFEHLNAVTSIIIAAIFDIPALVFTI